MKPLLKQLKNNLEVLNSLEKYITDYRDFAAKAIELYNTPENFLDENDIEQVSIYVMRALGPTNHVLSYQHLYMAVHDTEEFSNEVSTFMSNLTKLEICRQQHEGYRNKALEFQSKIYNMPQLWKIYNNQIADNPIYKYDAESIAQLINYCFHINYLLNNEYRSIVFEQRKCTERMIKLVENDESCMKERCLTFKRWIMSKSN